MTKRRSRRTIFAHWNMSHATNVSSMGRDVLVKWIKARLDIRSWSDPRESLSYSIFASNRGFAQTRKYRTIARFRVQVPWRWYLLGTQRWRMQVNRERDRSPACLVVREERTEVTSRNCEVAILTISNFIFLCLRFMDKFIVHVRQLWEFVEMSGTVLEVDPRKFIGLYLFSNC